MRLQIVKSKNAASLYVVKSTYINGIHSSKIVEKLGTVADLKTKLNGQDPIEWAKEYVVELTKSEKEQTREILVRFAPNQVIVKDEQRSFNGGYLFLQKIYHDLGFDKICKAISEKSKFAFDLNSILSRLVYGRIIFPASKLSTYLLSRRFIEQPNFELQHIYRALEVISKETEFIQSELYKNSSKVFKRKTGILYYDCTNYFFEIEQECGIKQFGYAKQHKPNPLVQMGLFMDADGIPLAFSIHPGNTNEQNTLKPLEQKILTDFNLSKFIVCTDAGLASDSNRKFNDKADRAFITTQSIKKLKKHLKEWALNNTGWHLVGDLKTYDLSTIDEEKDREKVFYKERWIKENELEQRLIVTYSIKYRDYLRNIRDKQIARAIKLIDTNPKKLAKANQNDYKRFINKTNCTANGEIAKKEILSIDNKLISQEEIFDGFYGVCTNLEDAVAEIIKINHRRWKIEECFRIMKSEFKARPVYLSKDDRIKAHFTTCFIALIIFRLLEKKLGEQFTCHEIIDELCNMNFHSIRGEGYVPTYTRNDLTDALHDAFGFRTDYQIVVPQKMKNIFKATKS
jgi:transposase